jgi:hypothetical protein
MRFLVRGAQIVLALAVLGVVGWCVFGPGERRYELDPFQQQLADRVVGDLVEALPAREDVRRVVLPPIDGDLDGRVTDMLRARVTAETRYELASPSKVDDAARLAARPGAPSLIDMIAQRLRGDTPPTEDPYFAQALAVAKKVAPETKADGALIADVDRTSGDHGVGAKVALRARLVRLSDGKELGDVSREQRIDSRFSVAYLSPWMATVPRTGRIFAWLVFTAALPFALYPVVVRVTKKENNRLNAALVAVLTLASALGAFALAGFSGGFGSIILVLGASALACLYHMIVCDQIDEARR